MKETIKTIGICLLVVAIVRFGLGVADSALAKPLNISDRAITCDSLDENRIYVLENTKDKMVLYSPKRIPMEIQMLNQVTNYTILKNDVILLQNYNAHVKGYFSGENAIFSIASSDYDDKNQCSIKIQAVPGESNKHARYYLGRYRKLFRFIDIMLIIKSIFYFILVVLVVASLIISLIKRNLNLFLVALFTAMSLVQFDVALRAFVVTIFFLESKILKRRGLLFGFLTLLGLTLIIPQGKFTLNAILLLIIIKVIESSIGKKNRKIDHSIYTLCVVYGTSLFAFESLTILRTELFRLPMLTYMAIVLVYYYMELLRNEKNKVSAELFRGVGHDFKIPLSVIKLNQEVSEGNLITNKEKGRLKISTNNAINDLERMINSLSAYYSKSGYVNKMYKTSLQDSFSVVEKAFVQKKPNIKLLVTTEIEDVLLPIESIWLNRLLYNLMDNAYKYSKTYGTVSLSYTLDKRKLYIVVVDEGIGMNKEILNNVFVPFYRGDNARSASGLGLGFTIIKDIVKQLNGDLKIKSEEGKGTRITLIIGID